MPPPAPTSSATTVADMPRGPRRSPPAARPGAPAPALLAPWPSPPRPATTFPGARPCVRRACVPCLPRAMPPLHRPRLTCAPDRPVPRPASPPAARPDPHCSGHVDVCRARSTGCLPPRLTGVCRAQRRRCAPSNCRAGKRDNRSERPSPANVLPEGQLLLRNRTPTGTVSNTRDVPREPTRTPPNAFVPHPPAEAHLHTSVTATKATAPLPTLPVCMPAP